MYPAVLDSEVETVLFSQDSTRISVHDKYTIRVNGAVVHLKKQEADVLMYLASSPGKLRTTNMIISELYPYRKAAQLKIIDILVCCLRKKLARIDPKAGVAIKTVWGRGYVLGESTTNAMPIVDGGLPDPNTRWTIARKAMILEALRIGRVDETAVLSHYPDMSKQELDEWRWRYNEYGMRGLRTTRALSSRHYGD